MWLSTRRKKDRWSNLKNACHHPGENLWTAASHWQTLSQCGIEHTSPWAGFTSVVIGIDCVSSGNTNLVPIIKP